MCFIFIEDESRNVARSFRFGVVKVVHINMKWKKFLSRTIYYTICCALLHSSVNELRIEIYKLSKSCKCFISVYENKNKLKFIRTFRCSRGWLFFDNFVEVSRLFIGKGQAWNPLVRFFSSQNCRTWVIIIIFHEQNRLKRYQKYCTRIAL